ncbi:MAG: hypothetical protein ACLGXA_24515 [Acidobacteriota bacterium]
MVIAIIVVAALAVVGYIVYRNRKTVVADAEKEAAALKASAEADLKKVESKL